jgi:hypothetical protein
MISSFFNEVVCKLGFFWQTQEKIFKFLSVEKIVI